MSVLTHQRNFLIFLFPRIHPLQFELVGRQLHLVVKAVALPLLVRDVHGDRTTAEEHPHIAVLCREERNRDKRIKFQRTSNKNVFLKSKIILSH